VKYCTTRDALILRAADLELPFVTHNDELLQMLAPQFEQELKEGRTKQSILGYEDPKSFYRAFRSWEGKTPAEWRAANQRPTSKRG
jgi:hypothetical protein